MIKKILAVVRYHINVFIFNIRFHMFNTELIKDRYVSFIILCKLRMKGNETEKIRSVIDRYFSYKYYLHKKESKEAYRELMNFIVEWAKINDVAQWEVRALINRDFNIDI